METFIKYLGCVLNCWNDVFLTRRSRTRNTNRDDIYMSSRFFFRFEGREETVFETAFVFHRQYVKCS